MINKKSTHLSRMMFILIAALVILISYQGFSQEMDMYKQIEKYKTSLKERYEDPLTLDIKVAEKEKLSWDGLRLRLTLFREACKTLYDPTSSSFNKTIAHSSNPGSFTATSKQGSRTGDHSIQVQQLAKSDKIRSKPIKKGTKLRATVFTVISGKNSVKIDFSKGGTLTDLLEVFYKAGTKVINAQLTSVDDEHNILTIESVKKGEKNKLVLNGDKQFFKELGFIQPPQKKKGKEQYKLSTLEKKVIKGGYSTEQEILSIHSKSEIAVNLPKPKKITKTTLLEAEISSLKEMKKPEKTPQKKDADKSKGKQPEIGIIEEVKVGRIKLFGEPLLSELDDNGKKAKPQQIVKEIPDEIDLAHFENNVLKKIKKSADKQFLQKFYNKNLSLKKYTLKKPLEKETQKKILAIFNSIKYKAKEKAPVQYLVFIGDNDQELKRVLLPKNKNQWQKVKINLGKEIPTLLPVKKLVLINELGKIKLNIRKVKIHDPFVDPLREAYNYIEKAQDARLLLNGVPIKRDKNNIDDLIKGVTINLHGPSSSPGRLKITWDYDKVVEQISKFIDEYNNVMLYLKNTMEYRERQSLEDLTNEEDKEDRKSFEEREFNRLSGLAYKGTMSREFSARSLKTKIRRTIVGTPYTRSEQRKIKFILQIGVKNPDRSGGKEENENLKAGYLYIDKEMLKSRLESNFEDIKHLFAHSTGKSVIKNNGIAVKLVSLVDGYAKKNIRDEKGSVRLGIIQIKKQTLESIIKRKEKQLERVKKRNENKVTVLIRKLKKLEQIKREAEARSKRMDNTFGNNNNK